MRIQDFLSASERKINEKRHDLEKKGGGRRKEVRAGEGEGRRSEIMGGGVPAFEKLLDKDSPDEKIELERGSHTGTKAQKKKKL